MEDLSHLNDLAEAFENAGYTASFAVLLTASDGGLLAVEPNGGGPVALGSDLPLWTVRVIRPPVMQERKAS